MTFRSPARAAVATALGVSALTLLGVGTATAAPATVTWTDNGTVYNRTIGTAMTTGIEYLSNLGHHADFKTQGPAITVGGTAPGGGTGSSDGLGSLLGPLLGGLGSSK
ncbi:hypothetical protein ACFXPS_31190 [Nocardia sp. NPDC059091]|uniref:hypothetical protein n=1 Tax=unclassified Nocardia TaxID=2637762 RepID=UPI0036A5DFA0